MATVTSRSVPRLMTSIRTTTTLRPHARAPTPTPRTITNFQGLQGLVQPWKVAAQDSHQVEESDDTMNVHLEALSHWHEEAEKMRQSRILPMAAHEVNIESLVREQVVDMMENLVQEELMDIRHGWMASTKF
ncbi:uncharacterized protein [Panulirus ornatus]|uniref:uncharacterized protein n=1 Tax=Panulirus ornatus TaxID=150431 RepID=UPI003A8B6B71